MDTKLADIVSDICAFRPLPLEAVTVLDFGQMVLGPYAGFLLAMAGARVIKIEPLGGESMRAAGTSSAYMFELLNTRKESLAVDLKTAEGRDIIFALAEKADIVLENFAPGVMDRLGVGADNLLQRNPTLVYGSASGYGAAGVRSADVAMDSSVQAMAGVVAANGDPKAPPVRAAVPVADILSGATFYGALVTALFDARQTGRGRKVELAMLEAMVPLQLVIMNDWLARGRTVPPRYGNAHPVVVPQGAFEAKDGWLFLLCATDKHWASLAAAIDPALAADARYHTIAGREERREELEALVSNWAARHEREALLNILRLARVPAAPIRNASEVIEDGPLRDRGFLHDVPHPHLGSIPMFSTPFRFDNQAGPAPLPAASLGSNAADILGEIAGMDVRTISDLRSRSIIL